MINTPKELLEFMEKIEYGYLTKSGKIYTYKDDNFDEDWYDNYILEDSSDVYNNMVGNCWDQVEFERDWFNNHNYQTMTFFEIVDLDYENVYPSHSFLCFNNGNKWYWFENADFNNRGIHEFSSIEELLKYQYIKYVELLKTFNITDLELNEIRVFEFLKPNTHISAKEYLDFVTNSDEVL